MGIRDLDQRAAQTSLRAISEQHLQFGFQLQVYAPLRYAQIQWRGVWR